MKKKNKLSRIGSALLTLMLVLSTAVTDVTPVYATGNNDVSVENISPQISPKASLGAEAILETEESDIEKSTDEEPIKSSVPAITKKLTLSRIADEEGSDEVDGTNTQPGGVDPLKWGSDASTDRITAYRNFDELVITEIKDGAALTGTDNLLKDIVNGDSIKYVVFADVDGDVVDIPANAFYGSNVVYVATVGSNYIRSVGDKAFFNCYDLEFIDLSKCTTIGASAFTGTSENSEEDSQVNYEHEMGIGKLTYIDLSECTSIGTNAFAYQESLRYIKFGKTNTNVGTDAFKVLYYYEGKSTLSSGITTTDHYWSSTPKPQEGKTQIFKRTYILGNSILESATYCDPDLWTAVNREVAWNDDELLVELKGSYIRGQAPTKDDLVLKMVYDQGKPGISTEYNTSPEIDNDVMPIKWSDVGQASALNQAMNDKIVGYTFIINVDKYPINTFEADITQVDEKNWQLNITATVPVSPGATETKAVISQKYVNKVSGVITDFKNTIWDSITKDVVGIVLLEWTDNGESKDSFKFAVDNMNYEVSGNARAKYIETEGTYNFKYLDDKSNVLATIPVEFGKIDVGTSGNPVYNYAAKVNESNIITEDGYSVNVKGGYDAESKGGWDDPIVILELVSGAEEDPEDPENPEEPSGNVTPVGEGSLILSGKFKDKDNNPVSGIRLVITNRGNEPLTPIATTDSNGEFEFHYDKDDTSGDPYLYVLKDSYKDGVVTGHWLYCWSIDLYESGSGYLSNYPLAGVSTGIGDWTSRTVTTNQTLSNSTKVHVNIRLNFIYGSELRDKYKITGKFVDKNGDPVPNLKLLQTTGAGTPATDIVVTDSNGEFSLVLNTSSGVTTKVFILNNNYVKGDVFNGCYYAYFDFNVTSSSLGLNGTHTCNEGFWTSKNVTSNYSKRVDNNCIGTLNVRLGFVASEIGEDPTNPGDDDKDVWGKIKGTFVDKDRKAMEGYYVVLNNWDTRYAKVAADGTFEIPIYQTDIGDRSTTEFRVYFTNRKTVGVGSLLKEDYYAYCKNSAYKATGEWLHKDDSNGIFVTKGDNVTLEYTANGNEWNPVCMLRTSAGNPSGSDPLTPVYDTKVTISGAYTDVNDNPISNKYIAVDSWDNAVLADKSGRYSFTVNDEKTHQIFFTNLDKPAANNAFNPDDVVASISFNTQKSGDNLIVTVDESKSNLETSSARANYQLGGSILNVDVKTKSVNDDNDIAIGLENMTLDSIRVSLDGQEGTDFSPYIGRTLTKDDFEVTAVYKYFKANGTNEPQEVEYTTGLNSKDWSTDKLTNEGLVVTAKEQSIVFRYTYKGVTAEEVVKVKGVVQPVANISGILRGADGKGLSNYVAYLGTYDVNTMTDADGKFEFTDVVDGQYNLYITKSKKVSASVGEIPDTIDCWFKAVVSVSDGKPSVSSKRDGDGVSSVNKVTNNSDLFFTIVYDADTITKVNIVGTFKSSEDKPITDQYIVLNDWGNAVKANSNGRFEFKDLEIGSYTLHFTNKSAKGSGSLSSSDYDYAKVIINVGQDLVEYKYTTYDGTTCDVKMDDEGQVSVNVKLSTQAEDKGTSNDTPTNQNTAGSKLTAGNGTVTIKGTLTDINGNAKSGLAVVIDDYTKVTATSSTGTFEIQKVENGDHTIVIHNVERSKLPSSGAVATTGDNVLVSYNITVSNGKVTSQNVGTNNVSQYAFSRESDDTVLNITTTMKAEATPTSTTQTTSGNSTDGIDVTVSTLPKTGLDFLEQAGITDGIAKIVGYDSPIVAMLTPAEGMSFNDGNNISRINRDMLNADSSIGVIILGIVSIIVIVGIIVSCVVIHKRKKENEISLG